MKQISLAKEIWQSEPKENLVTGSPVKEGLKLENKKYKDSILTSSPLGKTLLRQFLENTPYPDFRYFCPSCGSLDICITFHRQSEKIIVDCLDCKKEWIECFLHKGVAPSCPC